MGAPHSCKPSTLATHLRARASRAPERAYRGSRGVAQVADVRQPLRPSIAEMEKRSKDAMKEATQCRARVA